MDPRAAFALEEERRLRALYEQVLGDSLSLHQPLHKPSSARLAAARPTSALQAAASAQHALSARPESGPAPSASACRNALRSHLRSAGRAFRSVRAAPSGDASGLSSL